MTAASLRNVAWNTVVTFGIACASGAATWATSKALHHFIRVKENILYSPSFAIREAAVIAGGATAYALASRATLVSFPVDTQFCKFHCLHLLFGMYFLMNGVLISSKETQTAAMMFTSVGALLLLSTCAAGNRFNLFAAGGVGVIAGLRL